MRRKLVRHFERTSDMIFAAALKFDAAIVGIETPSSNSSTSTRTVAVENPPAYICSRLLEAACRPEP
jgi:hypothetical protein